MIDLLEELRRSQKFREWKLEKPLPHRKPGIEKSSLMKDERYYSPAEIATMWGISTQTARELFKDEEGVLKIGRDGTRNRRGYKTLRIPHSVAERVHTRLSA
jgi:hypothetical protein